MHVLARRMDDGRSVGSVDSVTAVAVGPRGTEPLLGHHGGVGRDEATQSVIADVRVTCSDISLHIAYCSVVVAVA